MLSNKKDYKIIQSTVSLFKTYRGIKHHDNYQNVNSRSFPAVTVNFFCSLSIVFLTSYLSN